MKPARLTIDDAHTPQQFAAWLQVSECWVRERLEKMPGVIRESREVVRIVPRYYIEGRVKGRKP